MTFRISTNVPSLSAINKVKNVTREVIDNDNKLSSGDRIYKSAFDPAGLAISEGLKSHIRSFGQAQRNANDGIALIQTIDCALEQVSQLGIRMKEMAIQAA